LLLQVPGISALSASMPKNLLKVLKAFTEVAGDIYIRIVICLLIFMALQGCFWLRFENKSGVIVNFRNES